MKKINITSLALFFYLIIMSVIGWPGNKPDANYTEYFLIMGATVVVIILLRFMQIKKMKSREKWEKDKE